MHPAITQELVQYIMVDRAREARGAALIARIDPALRHRVRPSPARVAATWTRRALASLSRRLGTPDAAAGAAVLPGAPMHGAADAR